MRSADLPAAVAKAFDFVEHNRIGGAILQLGRHDIAGHFWAGYPPSLETLHMLFAIEDALVGTGEIGCHFDFIVGRRRG